MSTSSKMTIRFWGVRGSVACSGPDTVRYGGNTACIEMRCGDRLLIFDAGTGVRNLGNSLESERPLDVDHFFSHTHWDHIVGFPFFSSAFCPDSKIRLHAGHLKGQGGLEGALRQAMAEPLFPVPLDIFRACISFHDFEAGTTLDPGDGISIRTAPLNHPNEATGYRVEYGGKSACYVTDTEHVPGLPDGNILSLIENADLLIYDCTFTDEEFPRFAGWGHSTWQEGVRLCRAANVKKLAIFHHEPNRTDDALDYIAAAARAEFAGAFVASDGLALVL